MEINNNKIKIKFILFYKFKHFIKIIDKMSRKNAGLRKSTNDIEELDGNPFKTMYNQAFKDPTKKFNVSSANL